MISWQEKQAEKRMIEVHLRDNNIDALYHFTALCNLESIKRYGGLYSWYTCLNKYIDVEIMGGSWQSHCNDKRHGSADYVRLSFCRDHPMAYRVSQDNNNAPMVLLKIDPAVALWDDVHFTDINEADSNRICLPGFEGLMLVHMDAVKRTYVCKNDPDFHYHQAEILVRRHIPLRYIMNIDNPERIVF